VDTGSLEPLGSSGLLGRRRLRSIRINAKYTLKQILLTYSLLRIYCIYA
jgi:hypothetical protein